MRKLGLYRAVSPVAPYMVLEIIWFSSFPALRVEKKEKVRERRHQTRSLFYSSLASLILKSTFILSPFSPMKYEPRGVTCREAVNECDVPETCTGDSSQVS